MRDCGSSQPLPFDTSCSNALGCAHSSKSPGCRASTRTAKVENLRCGEWQHWAIQPILAPDPLPILRDALPSAEEALIIACTVIPCLDTNLVVQRALSTPG